MISRIADGAAVLLLLLACLCGEWPVLMLALIGVAGVSVTSGGGPHGGGCP